VLLASSTTYAFILRAKKRSRSGIGSVRCDEDERLTLVAPAVAAEITAPPYEWPTNERWALAASDHVPHEGDIAAQGLFGHLHGGDLEALPRGITLLLLTDPVWFAEQVFGV
jgi:hypothetical protein